MSSSFRKSFLTHLLIGGVIGILYFIFSHSSFFLNRLINSLFLASFFPLIFGGLRFVKNLGTFDLFIYSHRKLWKYGKHHEKFEEENKKIAPASTLCGTGSGRQLISHSVAVFDTLYLVESFAYFCVFTNYQTIYMDYHCFKFISAFIITFQNMAGKVISAFPKSHFYFPAQKNRLG